MFWFVYRWFLLSKHSRWKICQCVKRKGSRNKKRKQSHKNRPTDHYSSLLEIDIEESSLHPSKRLAAAMSGDEDGAFSNAQNFVPPPAPAAHSFMSDLRSTVPNWTGKNIYTRIYFGPFKLNFVINLLLFYININFHLIFHNFVACQKVNL